MREKMECDLEDEDEIEEEGWKMKDFREEELGFYYYKNINELMPQYGCYYCGMIFKTLKGLKHHVENCNLR